MKLIIAALSLVGIAVFFAFCKSPKYTAQNLPKEQIRFGKGGGFTGKEQTFILLKNGQLFDGENRELNGVKRKLAKSCFKTAAALQLDKMEFNRPGNTYSFIEVPSGEGFRRVVWGGNEVPPNSEVLKLHQTLMEMLRGKPEAQ